MHMKNKEDYPPHKKWSETYSKKSINRLKLNAV